MLNTYSNAYGCQQSCKGKILQLSGRHRSLRCINYLQALLQKHFNCIANVVKNVNLGDSTSKGGRVLFRIYQMLEAEINVSKVVISGFCEDR